MHLHFARAPTPASVVGNRDIREWVKAELLQTLKPLDIVPLPEVAMPDVENPSLDIADLSLHEPPGRHHGAPGVTAAKKGRAHVR